MKSYNNSNGVYYKRISSSKKITTDFIIDRAAKVKYTAVD
jgi:hypothetical protein